MPRILTGSILALAVLFPATSFAQNNCAARDSVVSKLEARYGETFGGGGLQSSAAIFEVWFSEEKGTWTILKTMANGTTCVMASGTNWREALPGLQKPAGIPG